MTESTDRPESECGPPVPATQEVQTSGRDEIVIPERPSEDHVDGSPIPETWAEYGQHIAMNRFDQRLFAASVKESGDTLLVKYIHPTNPRPLIAEYEAVETQDGRVAPKELVDTVRLAHRLGKEPTEITPYTLQRNNIKPFPASFGVGHVKPSPEVEEPTTAERNLIWSLHGAYLQNKTVYAPPDS